MNKLIEKINGAERLTREDALKLFHGADLLDLAFLAGMVRNRLHPEKVVTYVVDRNINYTNACVSGCRFCAFFRDPDSSEAYVITKEELGKKIQETIELGGTQILLQGGLNPHLDMNFYVDILQFMKSNFKIHVHGFSPPEILFFAEKNQMSVKEVLEILRSAGLGSIPGGGAEILVDEVRGKISPRKYTAGQWLGVMEEAHGMGIKTTSTMMFGHIETPEHIVQHLLKVRELQDRTGGFTAFIPWTFQPGNTEIEVKPATSALYLRVLAISRLFLDNVPNIQASWVTQGDKIAQVALAFGANDIGSTMIEENVVAAAGVKFRLPREEMIRLIEDAGFEARQRDCFYNEVEPAQRK